MRNAMKNKTYAHAPSLFALTTACIALTGFACTKSDSLGRAGERDGGTDTIGKDDTVGNDGTSVDRHDSAPDTAGKDGAVGIDGDYEAGTYLCQSNADGTCSAVTPNTSCLPLRGILYDQSANCLSATAITLYCSAWQTNTMGGFAATEGCLQIPQDGGTSIYRTFESDIGNPQWGSWTCDSTLKKYVSEATECGTSPTDGSPPFGDTSPDGSACASGYHPYYTAPGCGTNAVPVCLPVADAALAIAQFCACDGVTTVADDARSTISPYLYSGACKQDGGSDTVPPQTDAGDPCAACTAGQVCIQSFDGTCRSNGPTCKTVSDACRTKLSASGSKSCTSFSECQNEFCTSSPFQCVIYTPCGTEAPQAAIYCYGI
jgi:hypothetical protein